MAIEGINKKRLFFKIIHYLFGDICNELPKFRYKLKYLIAKLSLAIILIIFSIFFGIFCITFCITSLLFYFSDNVPIWISSLSVALFFLILLFIAIFFSMKIFSKTFQFSNKKEIFLNKCDFDKSLNLKKFSLAGIENINLCKIFLFCVHMLNKKKKYSVIIFVLLIILILYINKKNDRT